jgi:hypothetical protein
MRLSPIPPRPRRRPYPAMTRAQSARAWRCSQAGPWSRRRRPTASSSSSHASGGRLAGGGAHVPGAGAGLAGAPGRGRRAAARRTAGRRPPRLTSAPADTGGPIALDSPVWRALGSRRRYQLSLAAGSSGEVGVQHYSTITNQTSPHEACTGLALLDKVIYHTRSWRPSQQTVERSTLAQARRRRRRRHAQGFAEQPASTGCLRIDAQASRPRMGDA